MRRLIWVWVASCALIACENPDVRSDIVVYADHNPGITNGGAPITNPFTAQSTPDSPTTTAALKVVPGMVHPRGAKSWGIAAWAKYVFVGNYDQRDAGIFQKIEDQRI